MLPVNLNPLFIISLLIVSDNSFLVGYSRYDGNPMFGWLEVDGKSIMGDENI